MLNGQAYYNGAVKKVVVAFGKLFSDIKVLRLDDTGAVAQTVAVPISYTPREKWLRRLEDNPSLNNEALAVFPRLSFEVIGYSYDASRKLNKYNKLVCNNTDGTRKELFTAAPWNIEVNLYSITRTTEDSLNIFEQIVPTFQPEYTMALNLMPDMNVVQDVPIILNNVSFDDQYEGDFEQRRSITYTYSFTVKAYIYGPIANNGVIQTVFANVGEVGLPMGIQQYEAIGTVPGDPIDEEWRLFNGE